MGAVIFAVLGLVTELRADDWYAMGYLAVMVTAFAFVLWYSTVAAIGAGQAGLLTGIAPVSAALTGILAGATRPECSFGSAFSS
jgi:drug/metabolite transporter (DMT)-like permease